MAISDDLRSVQVILSSMFNSGLALNAKTGAKTDVENAKDEFNCSGAEHAHIVHLLCDNLSALADQVEALEGVPLAPEPRAMPKVMQRHIFMPGAAMLHRSSSLRSSVR